jgi:hypothetical protein
MTQSADDARSAAGTAAVAASVTVMVALAAVFGGGALYPRDIHNWVSVYGFLASPIFGLTAALAYYRAAGRKRR